MVHWLYTNSPCSGLVRIRPAETNRAGLYRRTLGGTSLGAVHELCIHEQAGGIEDTRTVDDAGRYCRKTDRQDNGAPCIGSVSEGSDLNGVFHCGDRTD